MSSDICSAVQSPFDAAFFNAVFGNVYDQREALLRASLLLRPGKHFPRFFCFVHAGRFHHAKLDSIFFCWLYHLAHTLPDLTHYSCAGCITWHIARA